MKNAMKKIMGLLLVAVLLVSVVPFQALAAEIKGESGYRGFDSITIQDSNGDVLKQASWRESDTDPETKKPRDILNKFLNGWDAKYTFVSAEYNGKYANLDDTLHTNFESTSVTIVLNPISVYTATVNYLLDSNGQGVGSAQFQRKVGQTLTFSEIAEKVPSGYKLTRAASSDNSTVIDSNNPATIVDHITFNAYVVSTENNNQGGGSDNSGNDNGNNNETAKKLLTANYYVDGNYKATKEYDVDGKYINELVEMGGYKSSNYSNITASVDGSDKGTENVLVKRGQTVKIYMATKTTSGSDNNNSDATKVLTAHYYIDGDYQKTKEYDVDGKTVKELVSDSKLGNYDWDKYNVTASVDGSSKNSDSVIKRGETVKIYLATKSSNGSSTSKVLTAHYYVDGDYEKTKEYDVDGKTVKELVSDSKLGNYDWDKYNVTASVDGSSKNTDSVIKRGETVKIYLATKSSNGSSSNKFPYKVYLHVYLNNNIGEPDRNINITNTLAADGVVSMKEVKNLIPTYYSAKDSNGISYDGLYLAKGNWVKDYVTDSNKMEKLTDVDVRTGEEYVHINVMITNAKAKSTSTADSSNPKTGDAIFMTITVMGLSAAALTGMYFYDKKRKAL